MYPSVKSLARALVFAAIILPVSGFASTSWSGVLLDSGGNPVAGATVKLDSPSGNLDYAARTSEDGAFSLDHIVPGSYEVYAVKDGKTWETPTLLVIKDGLSLTAALRLSSRLNVLRVVADTADSAPIATGGEILSSKQVSSLPLNERDFSKLLLLAAGTMTDTNGSANFTQQFAVNGQ